MPKLEEGLDYYMENGRYVFTEHFLTNRGYCCGSGCRHCPYGTKSAEEDDPLLKLRKRQSSTQKEQPE
ncbi:MAG: DUF5522 domain-containing protein [Bacteroidota bacterium]